MANHRGCDDVFTIDKDRKGSRGKCETVVTTMMLDLKSRFQRPAEKSSRQTNKVL